MFDASQYDVLDIQFPAKGMNQKISPDILDMSYAYIIENIIPQPLGEGQVRYGTEKLVQFPPKEKSIIKQFPYVSVGGVEQILLYVQEFVQDASATQFKIDQNFLWQFSFETDHAVQYVQDTPLKIEYTYHGQVISYDLIKSVTVDGKAVTITLSKNAFPAFDPETVPDIPVVARVSYSVGSLYLYDVAKGAVAQNSLRSELSVACIPRYILFAGKLYICNGVDRVMVWDGVQLSDVFQFLKEEASEIKRVNDYNVTFKTGKGFKQENYPVGGKVQINNTGIPSIVTITQASLNAGFFSFTVTEKLPAFNNSQIFYQAFIPRFNFMFVMYDRIWALGMGAAGLSYRNPDEAMRVYFMYKPGATLQWFDERNNRVPSFNLAENHGIVDNLESISFINGFMLFIGREKTQAWSGSEPVGGEISKSKPVLQFDSSLPVGAIHGDLVLSIANDVFMITKTGLQSFSTLNVAKQFAANSYDAVDPLVKQYVSEITRSNVAYRASHSFKYDGGSLAGFKIGFQNVLCSLFSTNFYAWTLFSGDFKEATAFCALGNSFYIAVQNVLYQYGDGNDGSPPVYGDEGGTCPVFFSWSLPVIKFKGKAYAGLFYDINIAYPSSFVIREGNSVSLLISGDLPKSYNINSPCRFDLRGDSLSTIPLVDKEANAVEEDDIGFRLDQEYEIFQDKFKFLARHFWVTLQGQTQDGLLSFKGIRFYGTLERKR